MTSCHFGQVLLTHLYIAQFIFFILPFLTTHITQKGLPAQNLITLLWGAGVKRSIVKTFLGAPYLNGWLTEKQCQSLSTGEF